MRSLLLALRSLIVPWGALPTQPRWTAGTRLPSDLLALYAGLGETAIGGEVTYDGDGGYRYHILVINPDFGVVDASGRKQPSGSVGETYRVWDQFEGGNLFELAAGSSLIGDSASVTDLSVGSSLGINAGAELDYGARSLGRGVIGSQAYAGAAANVSSTGVEVAVPAASWAVEPVYDFKSGRVYRITVLVNVFTSATHADTEQMQLHVRKGSASTAGTVIGTWDYYFPPVNSASDVVGPVTLTAHFKCTADVSTKLSLTVRRVTGTSTVGIYSDSSFRSNMVVEDIMSTAQCDMESELDAIS